MTEKETVRLRIEELESTAARLRKSIGLAHQDLNSTLKWIRYKKDQLVALEASA